MRADFRDTGLSVTCGLVKTFKDVPFYLYIYLSIYILLAPQCVLIGHNFIITIVDNYYYMFLLLIFNKKRIKN